MIWVAVGLSVFTLVLFVVTVVCIFVGARVLVERYKPYFAMFTPPSN